MKASFQSLVKIRFIFVFVQNTCSFDIGSELLDKHIVQRPPRPSILI